MNIVKLLYKIVESPTFLENYVVLKEYFQENIEISQAIDYLLETKHAANNHSSIKQNKDKS